MTVYVDDMRAPYRRMKMCHMIADSDHELHAMANKIGIVRRWFQDDHYDICLSLRKKAVAHGAVEVSRLELGRIVVKQRRAARMAREARLRAEGYCV